MDRLLRKSFALSGEIWTQGLGDVGASTRSASTELKAPELRAVEPEQAENTEFDSGQIVGRYLILQKIGKGKSGVVYSAYDQKLDRKIAIKFVHIRKRRGALNWTSHERAQSMLLKRAQSMAKVSHPRVTPLYDVGLENGRLFIAMELVEGQSVKQWIKQPRSWKKVLEVLIAAGEGLLAIHRSGLTHGNISWSNIKIDVSGQPKILNFGLRSVSDKRSTLAWVSQGLSRANEDLRQGENKLRNAWSAGRAKDISKFCELAMQCVQCCLDHSKRFNSSQGRIMWTLDRVVSPVYASLARLSASLQAFRNQAKRREAISMVPVLRAIRQTQSTHGGKTIRFAGVFVAVIIGLLMMQAPSSEDEARCRFSDRLVGIWQEEDQNRLQTAFLATKASFAADAWKTVRRKIDVYVNGWTRMYTEVCRAALVPRRQDALQLDLRMSCLNDKLAEVGAMVDVLSKADATTVEKSIAAVFELPSVESCKNVSLGKNRFTPENPEEQLKVTHLRRRLAEATALRTTGRNRASLELLRKVVIEAHELGDLSLVAEAMYEFAQINGRVNGPTVGIEDIETTMILARLVHNDVLAAKAETLRIFIQVYMLHDYSAAPDLIRSAEASVRRAENKVELLPPLLSAKAVVAALYGKLDDSERMFRESNTLLKSQRGEKDPVYIIGLNNLAMTLSYQSRLKEAEAIFRESLRLMDTLYGKSHPNIAFVTANLVNLIIGRGDYVEASRNLERAEAILDGVKRGGVQTELLVRSVKSRMLSKLGKCASGVSYSRESLAYFDRIYGEEHPDRLSVVIELTESLLQSGETEEALRLSESSVETASQVASVSMMPIAMAEFVRGKAFRLGGNLDQAEKFLQQAKFHYETSVQTGEESSRLEDVLVELGALKIEQGKIDEAIAHFRMAIDLTQSEYGVKNANLAEMYTGLGMAQLERASLSDARQNFARAQRLLEDQVGSDDPLLAAPIMGLGRVYIAYQDRATALALLQRANRLAEQSTCLSLEHSQIKALLTKLHANDENASKGTSREICERISVLNAERCRYMLARRMKN